MPGLNGTGPWGEGPRTGRGAGLCGRGLRHRLRERFGWGRGFGWRRGRGRWCRFFGGRGFGWGWRWRATEEDRKALLEEEAKALRERLKEIEEELRS